MINVKLATEDLVKLFDKVNRLTVPVEEALRLVQEGRLDYVSTGPGESKTFTALRTNDRTIGYWPINQ
jgi:hypothetical protein